jgi:hypothetical protein
MLLPVPTASVLPVVVVSIVLIVENPFLRVRMKVLGTYRVVNTHSYLVSFVLGRNGEDDVISPLSERCSFREWRQVGCGKL